MTNDNETTKPAHERLVEALVRVLDGYISGKVTAEQALVNIGLVMAQYERWGRAPASAPTIDDGAAKSIAAAMERQAARAKLPAAVNQALDALEATLRGETP